MTIKKLLPILLVAGSIACTLPSCKSSVPDAQVKTNVEQVLIPGVTAEVKDGVVVLNGTVSNEADKVAAENAVKALNSKESGVKSVTNNIMVSAPQPVVNTIDAALTTQVVDATKDYPTVTATVNDGVITVTGTIEKSKVQNLKMALDNLKPKRTDMSALTVK